MSPDELIKGKQSEGGKQPSVCKLKHPRTGMKTQTADVEKVCLVLEGFVYMYEALCFCR